ncbi:thiamine pyrophosphate-binding protein [Paractinoplanes brasiliensis]|uniref:Acetolactate synthase-1/2/3 large subunit n=1 Tax=Paractinoplanes brasiliensis TaxID=52695 RepID=A0A4R6J8B1_9ACTN|nr:thiamine pyrophosphate-binding protein [Actinoplanes brasiliensis]TDO31692.1 acetolactate synthase-1/2/3 large subunit [Actinoplanes brasiliensis]GID30714.1 acetolactate synthase [Actinoplanes brasiliensis]
MTRRAGARVVADMLDGYGVTHVFLVPAILRRTMAELERRHPHIERVVTHGEKAAAYMADGYARVSGRPGVAAAQVVGALNLAAGLREPFLAGSPVIALTGGRSPATKFRAVYQEVDDLPAFDPVTKLNATVDDAGRFPDMLRQAFRVATTGHPGPVHLQIQGNEGQLDTEETDAEPRVEATFARVPAVRPAPGDDSVREILRLLGEAERPVIVAGGGVRASGAGAELVALAETLGIPVATSANGKDTIPGTHPLALGVVGTYSRECANQAVARSDLVLFVGTRTGSMTTHFWAVPPEGTAAVQIDLEPAHLGLNYPLRAFLAADAKAALSRLAALARPLHKDGWLAETERLKAEWRDRYREVLTSDAVPIRPERIAGELTAGLPADAVLVADTGHAGMWMAQFHDVTSPGQGYLRSAGHLGWAFSAGVGAKCAAPERPVVVFTGDAGLYYHLGEIETAVRRRVNLITVVNNNHGGNQSKRGFDRAYGGAPTGKSRELWTYEDVDFARIAEGMGALGLRVDKPGDLKPALERALSAGRPAVIDVHTDIEVVAPLPYRP